MTCDFKQCGILTSVDSDESLPLLKYVFYKMVSESYKIIYCIVLTPVCLLQIGLWNLPNHILYCPYSSMSFRKLSLEATKSYIVLSLLKYVFYKMVFVSYQIFLSFFIYCNNPSRGLRANHKLSCPYSSRSFINGLWKLPYHILSCPFSSMSFTKWSLEATKSYFVLSLLK